MARYVSYRGVVSRVFELPRAPWTGYLSYEGAVGLVFELSGAPWTGAAGLVGMKV